MRRTSTRVALILIRDPEPMGRRIPLDGLYPEGISKDDFDVQHTVACTREDIREGFVMKDMHNLIERHSGVVAFQVTFTLAFSHRSLTSC